MSELPPPSNERLLLSWFAQAYLKQLPRKQRVKFLRDVTRIAERYSDLANIRRIRSREYDAKLADEIAAAQSWLKQVLPVLLEAGEDDT